MWNNNREVNFTSSLFACVWWLKVPLAKALMRAVAHNVMQHGHFFFGEIESCV